MTKIMVVDDHPVMRGGLAQTLNEEIDLEVTQEAGGAEEAMQCLEAASVDLAIVDVSLEGSVSGLELIKHMRERWPEVKVLVVSRHDESLYAERAIRAGARGYVMKLRAGLCAGPARRAGRSAPAGEVLRPLLAGPAAVASRSRGPSTKPASCP